MELIDRELLGEVTLVDDSRRPVRVPCSSSACAKNPMLYGQATSMPWATQRSIASCRSATAARKIAAIRLRLAAPHRHECDVEDVAAPASLSDCLVEDGNRFVEQPRPV